MKTHKVDERRKKLFSEHGHNSLKAYEYSSERPKKEESPVEHKANLDAHGKEPRKGKAKIEKTLHEFKTKTLHSGSKKGPLVKSKPQAVAIALSQARKEGAHIPKKHKK